MALTDLAQRLGLPKATAHRLCERLVATRLLARDAGERFFTLGPALHRLTYDTLNHGVVRGPRHEVLSTLVERIGETCNFTTFDRAQVLYLDRVEAAWPLRLTLDIGSHVPLHCTASGKLSRMTPTTLVSAKALRAECERIVRVGYSCDREEFIAGLIAVALPVHDKEGTVRAAVAVHAPSARMSLRRALGQLDAMKEAARRLEQLI